MLPQEIIRRKRDGAVAREAARVLAPSTELGETVPVGDFADHVFGVFEPDAASATMFGMMKSATHAADA